MRLYYGLHRAHRVHLHPLSHKQTLYHVSPPEVEENEKGERGNEKEDVEKGGGGEGGERKSEEKGGERKREGKGRRK